MHKRVVLSLLFFLFLLPAGRSLSFENLGQDCTKCHTLSRDEAENLLKPLAPDMKVIQLKTSPLKAMWEIFYESQGRKGIVYVDFSKKYLLSGQLLSIKDRKNLTQESFTALNKIDVSKIPLDDALVMGDPKARIRVIVFTDPD